MGISNDMAAALHKAAVARHRKRSIDLPGQLPAGFVYSMSANAIQALIAERKLSAWPTSFGGVPIVNDRGVGWQVVWRSH